jgi:hypothetical protein
MIKLPALYVHWVYGVLVLEPGLFLRKRWLGLWLEFAFFHTTQKLWQNITLFNMPKVWTVDKLVAWFSTRTQEWSKVGFPTIRTFFCENSYYWNLICNVTCAIFPTQAVPRWRDDLGTRTNIELDCGYVLCGPVFKLIIDRERPIGMMVFSTSRRLCDRDNKFLCDCTGPNRGCIGPIILHSG